MIRTVIVVPIGMDQAHKCRSLARWSLGYALKRNYHGIVPVNYHFSNCNVWTLADNAASYSWETVMSAVGGPRSSAL